MENILSDSPSILPADSLDYQALLNTIIANAKILRDNEGRRLPALRSQLESLGPAPTEDQPPEDKDVAKKRRQIANEISLSEGRIKQADLAISRAGDLVAEIGRKEQAQIQTEILLKGPKPIDAATWIAAFSLDMRVLAKLPDALSKWWSQLRERDLQQLPLLIPPLILLAAIFLLLPLRRLILRRWGPNASYPSPSYARRLAAAAASTVARILIPTIFVASLTAFFLLSLPPDGGVVLRSIGPVISKQVIWFLVVTGLAISAFSPKLPAWRIMPVPQDACALLVGQIMVGSGLILGLAILQSMLVISATGLPGQQVRSVISFLNALVAVVVFMPALRSRYWIIDGDGVRFGISRLLRGLAAASILAASLASVLGYANLSQHLLRSLSITAVTIGIVFLARALVGETLRSLLSPDGRYFSHVSAVLSISGDTGRRLIFWFRLLSEFVIWPPAIYLLLIVYGFSRSLLNTWVLQAVGGVSIGNLTVSPLDILAALVTVIVGFLAVGTIRRWMRERVMPNTGFDRGLQNSIATGMGYLGGIVVLMLGVAALGIDLSSLALVAGALSVGMGFGLKSVVENFVAGVLLLIERPFKAGDWIVVGSTEGIVKSISVRSTEIETFDRSAVIMPNSELIASPVVNWTHRSRIARVSVKVTIARSSDPRTAERLMLQAAATHPRVMRHPPPSVIFRSMGANLLLELRCFVVDTDYYLPVLSDLNFAIFEAFRAEGVGLP